ncbi:predicted protein [Naegleria gruberi]|uniref:Predicted protein n=1 Tax=Naegleria gruberi TaxID=5762 RepID=D2V612_NAEGR|nr:uncharacterized protein NAEGRDRAFT_64273 [Naegleria gruberi]EFC47744.1 predicted protein [Naegleria gruberi]|eukprot:XP_002680488.1 predicted protein [Naegleria gruberi strain NEG-M]
MVRHAVGVGMSVMIVLLLVIVVMINVMVEAQNIDHLFPLIESLKEEDELDLRGMKYNETQPIVKNPSEFTGYRVGLIASHCFEECELTFPYLYFAARNATLDVIGPWWVKDGKIASCEFVRVTRYAKRSFDFKQALSQKYDALIVVGGIWSSTVVRNDGDAMELIRQQAASGRLLATVCSGSTVLINAKLIKPGMQLTGSPSIAIDLENAGAKYLDVPVVKSTTNLITGRSPGGLDNLLFTEEIAKHLKAQKKLNKLLKQFNKLLNKQN